ncbi:MAG: beta-propeller fold lactonase family protein, partial [Pseudomonadota bacterium]|nr:beta-propeller fold lactonase family protein [Pseudomonadota bacterium]
VNAGVGPVFVTVDPSGRYVYVANYIGNTVSQYTIGAGGSLTPMTLSTVSTAGPDAITTTGSYQ